MAALLLPVWVRILGTVVLVLTAGVLASRAARTSGSARPWHGLYALVAAALALMFAANPMTGPGLSPPSLIVLAVAVVGVIAVIGRMVARRRSGGATWPWAIALVDLVILGYIQVPSPDRPIPVCVLFAAYLAVQVVIRATAALRALRSRLPAPERSLVGAAGGPTRDEDTAGAPSGGDAAGGALTGLALAVLALAMLYMISI
jgi:hypothetical protein